MSFRKSPLPSAFSGPSLVQRVLHTVVAGALSFASIPALASARTVAPEAAEDAEAGEEAPTTVSGTVALLRFAGPAENLRTEVQTSLEEGGLTVKSVALTIEAAAKKAKCKKGEVSDSCLETIGKWLNKSAKTASDYIVYGEGTEEAGAKKVTVIIYDIAKGERVDPVNATLYPDDFIAPLVVPTAVTRSLSEHIVPPGPITPDEQEILDTLDEPAKTPEEIAQEKRQLEEAQQKAGEIDASSLLDPSQIEVDLRADFKEFCREGKRKPTTKDENGAKVKDLRPACKRGPFWGYLQARSWVAVGLTAAAGAATIGFYGAALAAMGPYNDAVDELEDWKGRVNDAAGGNVDPSRDPNWNCFDGQCYADLAGEVSDQGAAMRQRAIIGDALLGTTAFLFGVTAIIIFQDRRDAKNWIRDEKWQKAVTNVRLSPMMGRVNGASFGFDF